MNQIELPAGMVESWVQFPACDGQWLRGNLILPGDGVTPRSSAILSLHGYGGLRDGPHNLLTSLLREAARQGFASLRFDLRGRGESDGDPRQTTLATMAEDAIAAARFLKEKSGCEHLVLLGICSGGNLAIACLDRIPNVSGLFLLSVFPFGEDDDFGQRLNRGFHLWRSYLQKALRPDTWKRLVRGQLNLKLISKILLKPFLEKPKIIAEEQPAKDGTGTNKETKTQQSSRSPVTNLQLFSGKIEMIYGDTDPDFQRSREYFQRHLDRSPAEATIHVIAGANHNFYSLAWTQEISERFGSFLCGVTRDKGVRYETSE